MQVKHLIVGCIVLLLFSIFYYFQIYPGVRFHRVRVKSFHVFHDLAEIEAALEFYHNNHGCYPPAVTIDGQPQTPKDGISIGYIPDFIESCTPASTPDLVRDIYSYKDKVNYRYGTNQKDFSILISRGPDGEESLDNNQILDLLSTPKEEWDDKISLWKDQTYDPTNGTFSSGDIFHTNNAPGIKDKHRDILKRPNKHYDYTW